MPTTSAYSFVDNNVSFASQAGGFNFSLASQGSAEGGVTVEMEGDKNNMTVGADGSAMHNLHASEAGTITVRLLKTSPANAQLMAAYNAQRFNSALWGKNSVTIVNANRGEQVTATGLAFKKKPNLTYAMDGGENEWTFDAAVIDMAFTPAVI